MTATLPIRLREAGIAHLIESDGPGGAERMVSSLAVALQRAGVRNLVLVPADGEGWLAGELRGTGVQTEVFRPPDRWLSPHFARWLGEMLRRHRIGLAHSHEFTMAVYGAWAARRAAIPHLFTMHGGRYYATRWRRRMALRVAARLSGAVVAVSETLRRHLTRDLWIRASRVVAVPNGARLHSVARSSLREELRLTDADHLAVAVGNLYPVKGHGHLLEALGNLAARFPRLHVAIAGRGELEGPLRARARALDLADRFHLLGLRQDIGNVLAAADVFVLPSLSEGVPLALLEAMLAARPVVATAVGDIPAILSGGQAGVLVPPGNAHALASGLTRLLSDVDEARRLGAAGARHAAAEYAFERMVERYVALYERLLPPGLPDVVDPPLQTREVAPVEAAMGRERT